MGSRRLFISCKVWVVMRLGESALVADMVFWLLVAKVRLLTADFNTWQIPLNIAVLRNSRNLHAV